MSEQLAWVISMVGGDLKHNEGGFFLLFGVSGALGLLGGFGADGLRWLKGLSRVKMLRRLRGRIGVKMFRRLWGFGAKCRSG